MCRRNRPRFRLPKPANLRHSHTLPSKLRYCTYARLCVWLLVLRSCQTATVSNTRNNSVLLLHNPPLTL